jgi:hypothetical protein
MSNTFTPPTKEELVKFEQNSSKEFSPPTQEELVKFAPPEVGQEEAPLAPVIEQITAPATGYIVGRTAQEAISKAGEKAEKGLEKIAQVGGTSPEQLKLIKENFTEFKAADPITEMNKLLATARGTNVGINQMYAEAEKLLADKKITPD